MKEGKEAVMRRRCRSRFNSFIKEEFSVRKILEHCNL